MSVWREVQETLYQRWKARWVDAGGGPLTRTAFENDKISPPDALWVRFSVKRMPGGQGTLGSPGNRKMDRVGMVFIQLFEPPGDGTGRISDMAEKAAKIFENCRIRSSHDIRFAEVEPGEAGDVEKGRWWGVAVEGRFDYEDYS